MFKTIAVFQILKQLNKFKSIMKKVNLLSKAQLKKIMGGVADAQRGVFPCLSADCSFWANGMYYYGSCGSAMDLKGCYCLATEPNGSLHISEDMPGCYLV